MKYNSNAIARIRFLSVCIFICALIITGKLYAVQIVNGDAWADRADRQYVRSDTAQFERGTIYFNTKDNDTVFAATLKSGFLLAVNPQKIDNPSELYMALRPYIAISREDFIARASRNARYVVIEDKLPRTVADDIAALNASGVSIVRSRWRFYPGGSMAAHALGFLAYKDDDYAGRYGLERYYDEVLDRGRGDRYVNFFAEIFSNIKETVVSGGPTEGDIITTIEPTVQSTLERTLEEINTTWESRFTGGIIMDPTTGAVYALALYPSYDPNNLSEVSDASIFSNAMVENVFEMGSIIKPLTIAAGLDAGAITATTMYNDTGCLSLNRSTLCNYDLRARGVVSMQEVLNQSLNTGVTFIMQQMGKHVFAEYMKNFGIGIETGIDLPNETHGLIKNLESPRDIEYATASFGQGIAITPIATVRALSALANGGVLPNPHLVKSIKYRVGGSRDIVYPEGKRVISEEASQEISRMLTAVVDTAMLNGKIKLDKHSVAAKTGTAQIAKSGGGGYYDDRYLHSFFGYFPSYKPRFIVFLFTVEPVGVRYASETLAEPFGDLTKFLINYYEIPPDRGLHVPPQSE